MAFTRYTNAGKAQWDIATCGAQQLVSVYPADYLRTEYFLFLFSSYTYCKVCLLIGAKKGFTVDVYSYFSVKIENVITFKVVRGFN